MGYHHPKRKSFRDASILAHSGMTRTTGAPNHQMNHQPGEDPFQTIHCDWGTCDLPPVLLCGPASKKFLRGKNFRSLPAHRAILCIAQGERVTAILNPNLDEASPVFSFA